MSPPVAAPTQRDRILDVALDLMAEHGAAATSMRKLASACNLNVAALYHYFPSKADLLRSVIEERRYGLRLRALPAVDTTLPPHDRLVALLLAILDGVREEEAIWRLLLGEALHGDETATAVGREILETLEPALTLWIEELFPANIGEPAVEHAALAQLLVSQIFSFFISQLFRTPGERDPAARRDAESLATLVLG